MSDDEAGKEPEAAPPGAHRPTYLPSPPSDTVPSDTHSDDDLADALAAEFARLSSTQSITLPDLSALQTTGAAPEPSLPSSPPVLAEAGDPSPSPVSVPTPAPPSPIVASAPTEAAPTESAPTDSPREALPRTAPATLPPAAAGEVPATSVATLRPWSSLPAPDPAQAVPMLDSPSERPVRRSLPDDTLLHWADGSDGEPTSTLDIIQRLESQLDLREREAREYASWEARMLSLGTPDAVAALADARDHAEEPTPNDPALAQSPPLAEPETQEIDQVAPPEVAPAAVAPAAIVQPGIVQPVIVPALVAPPEAAPPTPVAPEIAPPAIAPGAPSETGPLDEEAVDDEAADDPGDSVENQPAHADAEPGSRWDPPPLVEPPLHPRSVAAQSTGAQSTIAQPTGAPESDPQPLFIDSLSLAAGQAVPTDTDSVAVIEEYETELDDDVDEFDRVIQGGDVGVAPPSGPISTIRIPDDEVVLYPDEPTRQRVFSLEVAGQEPTDRDHRVGRAARLFWLWFAANSSILSLALGAAIVTAGMSLRQSVVAVLAGTALSFLPLGLSTLAGKRSGQPTMVVSRATFGLVGNVVPAVLALVTRVFWGAVMLWVLASAVSSILVGSQLDAGLEPRTALLISLGVAFLAAMLIASAGYPLLARMQLILSIVSAVLVVGLIVLTAGYVNMSVALTIPDGPWLLTVTGAVLVFSFVGLVWAQSGGDLARYQRVGSNGGGVDALGDVRHHRAEFCAHCLGCSSCGIRPGDRQRAAGLASGDVQSHAARLVSAPASRGDGHQPAGRNDHSPLLRRLRPPGGRGQAAAALDDPDRRHPPSVPLLSCSRSPCRAGSWSSSGMSRPRSPFRPPRGPVSSRPR